MKAGSGYQSLVQGVSQQTAHLRREGQHAQQINMVPDPVRGLTRRHPTQFVAQTEAAASTQPGHTWTAKMFPCLGKDYGVLLSRATHPTTLPVVPFDLDSRQFVPVTADAGATAALQSGVATSATVGRFLLLVPNNHTPGRTVVDNVAATGTKAAVWVRGGAYSRKFSVTITPVSGSPVTITYTTPTSSYQGVLNTNDIPYAATDYAKQVNDRVNAYNGEVTKWIGTAAAAIAPEAIATSLYNAIIASPGSASWGASRDGAYVFFTNVASVNVDDAGDGTLIRGVANRVLSADGLTSRHFYGKTVQVQGVGSGESYYLKATPKTQGDTATRGEVVWEEAAGTQWTPATPWVIGTIQSGRLYLSNTHAGLASLAGVEVPPMSTSEAGDLDNNPPPSFTADKTTFIGVLQDRLVVSAGGRVTCSKTKEYFNFSRSTVLTLPADDPFEMAPASGADDIIRFACLWERGMLLFGDNKQYAINGKVALTPTSAALPMVSAHAGAGSTQPVVAGTSVFYSKPGIGSSSAYELTPGQTTETTESFDVSTQLDDYITGNVVDMLITPEPTALVVRTDAAPNSLFLFNFLDTRANGRVQDAWHRWDFSPLLGEITGMIVHNGQTLLFYRRIETGGAVPNLWVCDSASLSGEPPDLPYLDSQQAGIFRKYSTHAAMGPGSGQWDGETVDKADALEARWGRPPIGGTAFTSSVELTSPYVKDQKDRPILTGRTTISKIIVSCGESLGFSWQLEAEGQTIAGTESNRVVGAFDNLLGVNVPTSFSRSIPIGRENKRYALTLSSISWLPFTVDSLDWLGQVFNRTRRL